MEVVSTLFMFILGYLGFRAVVYTIDHEPPQACISIIETVEEEVKDIT